MVVLIYGIIILCASVIGAIVGIGGGPINTRVFGGNYFFQSVEPVDYHIYQQSV